MDRARKEDYLSDIYFWKFLIYFAMYGAVTECLAVQNERSMHVQNNVFSALVSNSLNMIGAGIDTPMSGFAVVRADSKDEALEIAKADPFLDMGGTIQVSEMMKMPG